MRGHSIPLSVPKLGGRESEYIAECLATNWVSYVGPFVERFEQDLARASGARFAVATSSGTAALHIALLLAGVGPDDEVLMPGVTFVAPANAVRYCGAWPVFTDIRADDWQWDLARVDEFLETACVRRPEGLFDCATGRRIAALMPVHLLGGMCDTDHVAELSVRHGIPVVEDAAECLGATRRGRGIGAAIPSYSGPLRLVATSFNGNKIITTGGGGALLTDDPVVAARAKHLTTTAKADRIEFLHDAIGYNYRLTNIAAALGVAQLEQLADFVRIKRAIAGRYATGLGGHSAIRLHPEPMGCRGTFWMYTVVLDRPSRPFIEGLIAQGIQSRPIWLPLARLDPFRDAVVHGGLDEGHALHLRGMSLPCSVGLEEAEQRLVMDVLTELLGQGGAK